MAKQSRIYLQNQMSVLGHKVRPLVCSVQELDLGLVAVNRLLYFYKSALTLNDRIALRQYYKELYDKGLTVSGIRLGTFTVYSLSGKCSVETFSTKQEAFKFAGDNVDLVVLGKLGDCNT